MYQPRTATDRQGFALLLASGGFLCAVPFGFNVLVALLWLVPDRRIERVLGE